MSGLRNLLRTLVQRRRFEQTGIRADLITRRKQQHIPRHEITRLDDTFTTIPHDTHFER